MPITPLAQLPQLLDLSMIVLNIIFHGQSFWIVDTNIASQTEQYACTFESQETRI